MKKLLLLAALALSSGISAWAYDHEPGYETTVTVNSDNGSLYRGNNPTTEKWVSWWRSTVSEPQELPQVSFGVVGNVNNIGDSKQISGHPAGNKELIISAGQLRSCTYLATTENPNWYVSKIEFDATTAVTNARVEVGSDAYIITDGFHFEYEYDSDEDAGFYIRGNNGDIYLSNFVITIKKMELSEVALRVINKYSFDQYPGLWSVEDALRINEELVNKAEEYHENLLAALYENLVEYAEEQLAEVLLPQVNNKYATFKDRATSRYIAAYNKDEYITDEEQAEAACSRMIENGDDMHAIWRITYDETEKHVRFHHYVTDLDLGNNNLQNTELPVYDHSELSADAPGALFTLRPVRIKTGDEILYIVELEDNTDANSRHFIHDNTDYDFPIKWNSAEVSPGSGWFITLLDINPDGEMAGLKALDSENKDVVIYNSTTGKYLSLTGDNSIGYIDELRPSAIWKIDVEEEDHDNGEIVIKHLLTGKYANSLAGELSTTSNPTLKVVNYVDEHATWNIVNRNVATVPDDADKFTINEITDEQKAQMISDLEAVMVYEIGDEPGMYSYSDTSKDSEYNNLKESVSSINGEDGFDYETANKIFNLKTPALFDLNSLNGVALIRIKSHPENTLTANAYLTNTNSGSAIGYNREQDASSVDNTIFVLHEGKLSTYEGGKYIIDSNNHQAPAVWESDDVSDNNGTSILISEGGRALGGYLVCYDEYVENGATKRAYIFCNNTSTARGAVTTPYEANINAQNNWYGYYFNVEYVKTLAVDVDENGFKLWRTPVTVNFGDNADSGAYVVSVAGDKITTALAEKETNYGAGTIFILTKNIVANVVNGDATVAPTAGLGHHAAKAHNVSAQKVYMEIHPDQSPEVAPAGLYFDGADVAQVRMAVKIYDADQAVALDPHSAVIEADKDETTSLQHGDAVMLPLGDSYTTTAISELTADKTVNAVYDLQGRRLVAPRKGINIVNGKKIVL